MNYTRLDIIWTIFSIFMFMELLPLTLYLPLKVAGLSIAWAMFVFGVYWLLMDYRDYTERQHESTK